eukprot:TRINITY_DN3082_c0_g1_i1.p1 TRINITY_DN3082_c0_g1~~TRINITY_DN3082_c0_g1_i1.p1  ORF type:complete len:498 (-),score=49.88 TRINITY_DN3082_c0_g1_i1:13-1446(-)
MTAPLINPTSTTLAVVRGLPAWSCDEGARGLAESFYLIAASSGADDRPISLQSTAGPAVTLGFLLLKLTWLFFAIFPWCVGQVSVCSKLDLATYPFWIWIAIVPCLAVAMVIEKKCFGYVVIPVAQVLRGRFKILTKDVSVRTLSFYSGVMSNMNRMDIVTNALFFGVSLKTQNCSEMMVFEKVWQNVLAQSLVWWCPVSFRVITAISWLLMFLQPAFAILEATPLYDLRMVAQGTPLILIYEYFERKYKWHSPQQTEYRMHTDVEAYRFMYENSDSFSYYQTFTNLHGDHGSSMLSLADANRAVSLNFLRFAYAQAKVRFNMASADQSLVEPSWGLISREVRRCVNKLVLTGILESAVQLNLQASLLGLHKSVTQSINYQTAFSISIGVLVNMMTIIDCAQKMYWVHRICRKEHVETFKKHSQEIEQLFRRMVVACLLHCLALAYVVFKLFGLFYCKNSLINLTGCASVDVAGLLS